MLSERSEAAMNEHMNKEFYASWLYLSMAAYLETTPYDGFASWMRTQSAEEHAHAMKFYAFISDRDARIRLGALDEPPSDFGSPLDAFRQALEHEKKVTEEIHSLYEKVRADHDHPSEVFLQWFIAEQVEEEKTITQIVEKLEVLGDNEVGLFIFDRELAGRESAGAEAAP